jgi:hypothetical protein
MTNTSWPVRVDGPHARELRLVRFGQPERILYNPGLFRPCISQLSCSLRPVATSIRGDRTGYRLLSQLGTDSSWEQPGGKINLNYDNVFQSNRFSHACSATNLLPWTPVDFFRASANKMLANAGYDPIGSSNPPARISDHIQIYHELLHAQRPPDSVDGSQVSMMVRVCDQSIARCHGGWFHRPNCFQARVHQHQQRSRNHIIGFEEK